MGGKYTQDTLKEKDGENTYTSVERKKSPHNKLQWGGGGNHIFLRPAAVTCQDYSHATREKSEWEGQHICRVSMNCFIVF